MSDIDTKLIEVLVNNRLIIGLGQTAEAIKTVADLKHFMKSEFLEMIANELDAGCDLLELRDKVEAL